VQLVAYGATPKRYTAKVSRASNHVSGHSR
jgi:hypothetical protein